MVVNDLTGVPHDVYLVLDDYHLVDGPDIQAGMAFLLEHLPPQSHLVVSTRADPALPLARLRARGELVEVRAADLRFTLEEAAAYLNDAVGLDLAANDISTLSDRTEGWIAALQLAALSMQGRDDVAGFIAGFAGDDRYIVDYLVDEVLARQTADVHGFLIQTCVLDRLCGPLCDAVTGQPGGKAMLESLDRENLFVVPLDDSRRWYRYHHLFAGVLHAHLMDEQPDRVARLHRRASQWYEGSGEPSAAIRHALAAGDVERAADLVELAIPALRRGRQEATIRGWVDAIPDEVVGVRPVLAVGFIGALLAGGEFDGVERRLRAVERWLERGGDGTVPAGMVVVDGGELPRLPAAIAMYRAALAMGQGDVPGAVGHARLAIDRAADDDHLVRAAASGLMGLGYWGGGDPRSPRPSSVSSSRSRRGRWSRPSRWPRGSFRWASGWSSRGSSRHPSSRPPPEHTKAAAHGSGPRERPTGAAHRRWAAPRRRGSGRCHHAAGEHGPTVEKVHNPSWPATGRSNRAISWNVRSQDGSSVAYVIEIPLWSSSACTARVSQSASRVSCLTSSRVSTTVLMIAVMSSSARWARDSSPRTRASRSANVVAMLIPQESRHSPCRTARPVIVRQSVRAAQRALRRMRGPLKA
jgi:hypothetical protein